jgi:hypothetical protein
MNASYRAVDEMLDLVDEPNRAACRRLLAGHRRRFETAPGSRAMAQAPVLRMAKLAEYGIALTPDHENGLTYVEGELGGYSNRRRAMGPLAAVAHMCDVASARLWFDHPRADGDPWPGAGRFRGA